MLGNSVKKVAIADEQQQNIRIFSGQLFECFQKLAASFIAADGSGESDNNFIHSNSEFLPDFPVPLLPS